MKNYRIKKNGRTVGFASYLTKPNAQRLADNRPGCELVVDDYAPLHHISVGRAIVKMNHKHPANGDLEISRHNTQVALRWSFVFGAKAAQQ